MLRGAVFDLDGVLVDTEQVQWQGWVEVLKPHRVHLPLSEYFQYAGKTGQIIAEEIVQKHGISASPTELRKQKDAFLHAWFSEHEVPTLPYAREALLLFLRSHIPVLVATGGSREESIVKIKRSGLADCIPGYVCLDDVSRGKPFPDIYLEAARRLDVAPMDCVAFEDTQYGVAAAKAAGLVCCAIPNAYSRQQDFSAADAVVASLQEACRWARGE